MVFNLWRICEEISLIDSIWNDCTPKKVRVFLWSLAHREVNTHDLLQRRCVSWVLSPSVCLLCLKIAESLEHLLIHCPFTSLAWNWVLWGFNISLWLPDKIENWLIEALSGWRLRNRGKVLRSVVVLECYSSSFGNVLNLTLSSNSEKNKKSVSSNL